MEVLHYVLAAAPIVISIVVVSLLVRRRRYRLSQVITAPAAIPVRLSLVVAVGGLAMLTGAWPLLFVQSAIIAWELAVQVTARVRRHRKSAA
jgi:hypothetical protein